MPLDILKLVLSTLLDLRKWVYQEFKKPDPVHVLKRRQELKQEFEKNLPAKDQYGVRSEAIIRDTLRMDSYPEINVAEKGISPWFKVEVKGLYHRGVEVFLSLPRSVEQNKDGEWQFAEHEDAEGTVRAYPVGRIPFDLIDHTDWDGDEFYPFLHVYCRFKAFKGQPYESVPFFVERGNGESKYMLELEGFTPLDRKKGRWFLRGGSNEKR